MRTTGTRSAGGEPADHRRPRGSPGAWRRYQARLSRQRREGERGERDGHPGRDARGPHAGAAHARRGLGGPSRGSGTRRGAGAEIGGGHRAPPAVDAGAGSVRQAWARSVCGPHTATRQPAAGEQRRGPGRPAVLGRGGAGGPAARCRARGPRALALPVAQRRDGLGVVEVEVAEDRDEQAVAHPGTRPRRRPTPGAAPSVMRDERERVEQRASASAPESPSAARSPRAKRVAVGVDDADGVARDGRGGTATLAAAETAHSNDDVGASPRCATARVSRNTVARVRQGCSSRRTMSSPLRAVDFQCTRRSSSPVRYSRGMTSSSPAEETARARASPRPDQSPPSGMAGSGTVAGHDGEGVGGGELAGGPAQPERVDELHRHGSDRVAAAGQPAQLVAHVAPTARLEPVEHEALRASELPRHRVLDEQQPAGQP